MLMRRIGRPGLLGLAARTAVVAGTATAVSGGMMRHSARKAEEEQEAAQYEQQQAAAQYEQQQAAAQYQQPSPAAPPASVDTAPAGGAGDLLVQIKQLADLHAAGALSDEEFSAAKAKLLGS